jgi:hypothetical protein
MYTITWISVNGIESISSPKMSSVYRTYTALIKLGHIVRLWKDKQLIM